VAGVARGVNFQQIAVPVGLPEVEDLDVVAERYRELGRRFER
jgi:hypothetical protein